MSGLRVMELAGDTVFRFGIDSPEARAAMTHALRGEPQIVAVDVVKGKRPVTLPGEKQSTAVMVQEHWTEADVRAKCPQVVVKVGNRLAVGKVRKNRRQTYATVTWRVAGVEASAQWTYSDIVKALNEGKALAYG